MDVSARARTIAAMAAVAVVMALLAIGPIPVGAQATAEAGVADAPPIGLRYATATRDVLDGDTYHFAANSRVQVDIGSRVGANNQAGTFHEGWPADLFLRQPDALEPLDWSQLVLTDQVAPSGSWTTGDWHIPLPDITVDGPAVVASGTPERAPLLDASVRYEALGDDAPVVRMQLTLANPGPTDHQGFFQYMLDPDLGGDVTRVPGIATTNPGNVASGYTGNWMASTTRVDEPSTAIAWAQDVPHTLHAAGFIMGAWWAVDVPAGGEQTITWYHITDVAQGPDLTAEVAGWAGQLDLLDPDVPDRPRVAGRAADEDGQPVVGAEVVVRNVDQTVAGSARTAADGTYEIPVDRGTYTLTATRLQHVTASRSVEVDDSATVFAVDFEMPRVTASATTGKVIPGPRSEGGREDVVLENQQLAMAISRVTEDGQLDPATVGKPLDLVVAGVGDELDWINLPWLSPTRPEGVENWRVRTVISDRVDAEVVGDVARVVVGGRYTEDPDVTVETVYELAADDRFVTATTTFRNAGSADVTGWTGDAIDIDVADQSWLPGIGAVTAPYASPEIYTPSQPWMAMRGAEPAEYGVIYTDPGAADVEVMGAVNYLSSQRPITIPAAGEHVISRRIFAVPVPDGAAPFDASAGAYDAFVGSRTGLSLQLDLADRVLGDGESTIVTAQVANDADVERTGTVTLGLPPFLGTTQPAAQPVVVPPGGTAAVTWEVQALGGGRGRIAVLAEVDGTALTRSESVSATGVGWYWGDNHSHSRFSDGSGTIAENFASARSYGLSWLTATDHNTIAQRDALPPEQREDFVALYGEEITSSDGHSLAYNIDALIDWRTPAQQRVDDTNASNGGQGMFFIAHPYYPGLEWDDYDIEGVTGIEVWNGFYPPRHPVNAQAFATWDALNAEGRHLIGIANSDAHNPGKIGSPHIRACLPELSEPAIDEVIGTGYFYGSNGPDLRFTVDGARMGGDLGVPAAGATVAVAAEARADELITAVLLLVDGQVVERVEPGASSWMGELSLDVDPGQVVRLEVETEANRFAFSNPVWVVEGDGPVGGPALDCTPEPLSVLQADAGGPYQVAVGRQVVLDASRSTGEDLSFAWDLDGDGAFDDAEGPTPTVRAARPPGTYEVAVQVTDADGATSTATTTMVVRTGR